MDGASQQKQNRMIVGNIGDLVEALFSEVSVLPLSASAKTAMVTVIISDMT